ncbi:MAG TPA: HEPN domain-containing protein [Candidatus Sumerlaeota bacterium]|nr:MAG: HEPN domain protein [candidate division BRC1 bacterium ADurb.Bin183]HOE63188.1 HEPN domain-containing protein [Candidatus Sumerlaeota bacterium]HRR31547.1 HEPN domain-containing protein [Candidatus Sumerlaeia bacterium]HON50546.1 HEPN domain-containing protein [Candidatus Sumerlaeota bacterium]HOR65368.1 HEPN domain-containing protein [Candidatus Sumerlaeota bacterium]
MDKEIRKAVNLWISKAESDWVTIEILLDNVRCPKDTVCFHCQQYVEKLLKGLLTLHSIEAPRTHDLRRLIELSESLCPSLSALKDSADILTEHSVQSRYPDDWREIDLSEMNQMVQIAKEFGSVLIPLLKENLD